MTTLTLDWFNRITPVCSPIAFLLLFVVNLSAPVTKTIFLFRLSGVISIAGGVSGGAALDFGLWGFCYTGVGIHLRRSLSSIIGQIGQIGKDVFDAAEPSCYRGYTLDSSLAKDVHLGSLVTVISNTLAAALALHTVAAVLTFVAILNSLFIARASNKIPPQIFTWLAHGPGILATIITTIVALIDLIAVGTVQNKIHRDTAGFLTLNWGNAVWMTLVAAILLWVANAKASVQLYRDLRAIRSRKTADMENGLGVSKSSTLDSACSDEIKEPVANPPAKHSESKYYEIFLPE
ncbi:hypothetical protein DFH06DRAFT_335062 [Mycena polygramma]|nr:hypothetical protein DFH06DRAFT_335062 [Mycena polygramma]